MRIKHFAVSVELLRRILAPGAIIPAVRVVLDGWPEDARVLAAWIDGDGFEKPQTVWLKVESETFDDVLETNKIPFMTTTFDSKPEIINA